MYYVHKGVHQTQQSFNAVTVSANFCFGTNVFVKNAYVYATILKLEFKPLFIFLKPHVVLIFLYPVGTDLESYQ